MQDIGGSLDEKSPTVDVLGGAIIAF